METNVFFDTEDRLAAGRRTRIAPPHQDASRRCQHAHYHLQRPPPARPAQEPVETELDVADAKDAVALLEVLGFRRVLSLRRSGRAALNDCEVELDELPYLGVYVEIEGRRTNR